MIHLAILVALEAGALADVMCAEARGLDDRERLAIGQVAISRSRASGRSILAEVSRPAQFARGCPLRARARHLRLAVGLIDGKARAPRWASTAVAFCTPRAARKVRRAWVKRGLVPIRGTRTVHIFWRERGR